MTLTLLALAWIAWRAWCGLADLVDLIAECRRDPVGDYQIGLRIGSQPEGVRP